MYKKAQRAKPDQTSTYLELADLYVQKGLIGEAKSNYLQAAEMQAASGEKHESLDTYRKIADLDPNNVKIRSKLAAMYESEDFMEDAAGIYVDIGDVMIQDNLQEGQAFYKRAIELQSDNEEILSRIGYSYADLDMRGEATKIFRQLNTMFPDNIDYKEQVEMLAESVPPSSQQQPTTPSAPSASIEFSEEELTSLNFGEDEPPPSQEHTLDFQVEHLDSGLTDISQPGGGGDDHTLDFQIEEQGAISWIARLTFRKFRWRHLLAMIAQTIIPWILMLEAMALPPLLPKHHQLAQPVFSILHLNLIRQSNSIGVFRKSRISRRKPQT